MNKNFSGNKVTIGCVIYLFCMMGFLSAYMSGFALLPEEYGIDVALVSTANSMSALFGFISSMFYATLDDKFHAKGILYLGAIFTIVGGCAFQFLSGFIGLCIGFGMTGILLGLATYTVITEVISNWFVDKRADKIALTIGAGAFGMAAYQFVGGYIFDVVGIRTGYFLISIFNAVVLFVATKFMIVANSPEEVNQVALGAENVSEIQETQTQEIVEGSNIYKNPTFWFGCLARFAGAGAVMFVATYATMYFGNAGMSLTLSATIISLMTLISALFAMVSGKLLGALNVRGFLVLVFAGAALCNVAMVLFGSYPSMIIVVFIVIFYSIGNAAASINNLIIDKMFAPQDVANANSKIYAFMMAGNIAYLPLAGVIIQNFGYTVLYIMFTVLNVIALLCYLIALSFAKKQNLN